MIAEGFFYYGKIAVTNGISVRRSVATVPAHGRYARREDPIEDRPSRCRRAGLCRASAGRRIRRGRLHVTGIDLSEGKVARINAGDSYIGDVPSSALAAAGRRAANCAATTDFSVIRESGHHQHLRADAAAQDQRSGHELHRGGLRGDREYFHPGHAGDSGIDHLSRARPTNWCCRCWKNPA